MSLQCFYLVTAINSKLDYLPVLSFCSQLKTTGICDIMLLVFPWFTGNPAGLGVIEARSDCGPMDPLTLRNEEGIPLF